MKWLTGEMAEAKWMSWLTRETLEDYDSTFWQRSKFKLQNTTLQRCKYDSV